MHTVRRILVAASLLALLGLMVGGSLDNNEERSRGALMPTAVEYAVML
jgi:hypothetical protein